MLATCGRDSVVSLWDLRKHAKLGSIPALEPLEGVAFLPASTTPGRPAKRARTSKAPSSALDGLLLATAGSSGQLKVRKLHQRPANVATSFPASFQHGKTFAHLPSRQQQIPMIRSTSLTPARAEVAMSESASLSLARVDVAMSESVSSGLARILPREIFAA